MNFFGGGSGFGGGFCGCRGKWTADAIRVAATLAHL